jgi:ribosome maturation factor RimP
MINKETVSQLISEALEGSDKFLVDFTIKTGNNIQVYIDGDNGVTITDCKMLSRHIESSLDREEEDFELHVSSSGLDKPLKLHRQYLKNIGRKIQVVLNEGAPVTGTLLEVTEESLTIEKELKKKKKKGEEPEDPKQTINFDAIKQAFVVISFK